MGPVHPRVEQIDEEGSSGWCDGAPSGSGAAPNTPALGNFRTSLPL